VIGDAGASQACKELRQLAPGLKKKAKLWLTDNPITQDDDSGS
jgi:hypothetical protein